MLRHRGVRGVAPVQPADGGDVPRRPQVRVLGQLPSYREGLRDHRGLSVPKIRREAAVIVGALLIGSACVDGVARRDSEDIGQLFHFFIYLIINKQTNKTRNSTDVSGAGAQHIWFYSLAALYNTVWTVNTRFRLFSYCLEYIRVNRVVDRHSCDYCFLQNFRVEELPFCA